MRLKCIVSIAFFILIGKTFVSAHPVTWKDGFALSSMVGSRSAEHYLNYSYRYNRSVGLYVLTNQTQSFGFLQHNTLHNRWYGDKYQGNLYSFLGVGYTSKHNLVPLLGLQADWESRSIYTFVKLQTMYLDSTWLNLKNRVGWAPYKAEFKALNTWFILELNTMYYKKSIQHSLMPVIRLFQHNVLVELGSNLKTRHTAMVMVHF